MDILIPMEGLGSRFSKEGYTKPKPFLDIDGKTMIESVIDSLDIRGRIILILSGKTVDANKYIQEELEKFSKKYNEILFVKSYGELEGAAKSCLKAKEYLIPGNELIVTYCDQLFDYSSDEFLEYARGNNFDGVITTYNNDEPKDDFLIYDGNMVLELVPKKVVSDLATTGMYYWRDNSLFLDGANKMISKNIRFNGEYYVGPIFNENIRDGYNVGYYNIGINQVGNPQDYEKYLSKLRK